MGPFHMSKVTKYKLIPSEMVAFELSSGNKRDGLSTLQSNFNLFDHKTIFHFDPEKKVAFLDHVHTWCLLCIIVL